MSKILNTTYNESVEKLSSFQENLVSNPFYLYNDKKPVLCTYFNINKSYSSSDPGSGLIMDNIGSDSPIRYNMITDFILLGFNKIELSNSLDEFGVEADRIEGECYILPNTIIPTENDYFIIDHIKDSKYLFIVKDVQRDTLDNGYNAYKISYRLEYTDASQIQDRVIHNFKMIEEREGTNIVKILRTEDYNTAKIIDDKAVMLKKYYEELFYNEKVQTFTYMDLTEFRTYDPYMIEFLIRNKILDNGRSSYIHVCHQLFTPKTFSIDYDRTIFRVFELAAPDKILGSNYSTYLTRISSFGTTFAARYEDYYRTEYKNNVYPGYNTECYSQELLHSIVEHKLETDNNMLWKNIIIKHFYNEDLTKEEVDSLDYFEFSISKDAFYLIPIMIFCLEVAIDKIIKNGHNVA